MLHYYNKRENCNRFQKYSLLEGCFHHAQKYIIYTYCQCSYRFLTNKIKYKIFSNFFIKTLDFYIVSSFNKKEHSHKDECSWYHLNLYMHNIYLYALTQQYVSIYFISINILRGYLPFFHLSLSTIQRLSLRLENVLLLINVCLF